jgi:LL-H family phage holin
MNEQIILVLIASLTPTLIGLIVYTYHQAVQRLPEKQKQALQHLETLAMPIVQYIEQYYGKKSPEDKKATAVDIISSSLQFFGAAMPDNTLISAFIESAVFEMNRLKAASANTSPTPQISQFKQQKESK